MSAPSSPKKSSQARRAQSPRIGTPSVGQGRKRVISKEMIGKPTNFQVSRIYDYERRRKRNWTNDH